MQAGRAKEKELAGQKKKQLAVPKQAGTEHRSPVLCRKVDNILAGEDRASNAKDLARLKKKKLARERKQKLARMKKRELAMVKEEELARLKKTGAKLQRQLSGRAADDNWEQGKAPETATS